jgi:hypothetical protein
MVESITQPQFLKQSFGSLKPLPRTDSHGYERIGHIFPCGKPSKEIKALKDKPNSFASNPRKFKVRESRHISTLQIDLAPSGAINGSHETEERRFA